MDDRHKKMVGTILKKYPYTFYAYGSRTKGTHRPSSDLDLCFIESIPLATQALIEEEFENSDLPFEVEVNDFNLMKKEFQQKIKPDLIVISEK